MRKLALLAAVTIAATAVPASAATVVYNGTTYSTGQTINISYTGVNTPDAHGQLALTFTGTGTGAQALDYLFTYSLTNNSVLATNPNANISAFGFDVAGGTVDVGTSFATTNAPNNGSAAINTAGSGNISGGNNKLDFCATAGSGNNCAGGSNGGPKTGNTFTGTVGIEFKTALPSSITLSNPIIRFQNTVPTGSDIGTPNGQPPLPEPATWAMMLIGFGATGYALRRGRRRRSMLQQLA